MKKIKAFILLNFYIAYALEINANDDVKEFREEFSPIISNNTWLKPTLDVQDISGNNSNYSLVDFTDQLDILKAKVHNINEMIDPINTKNKSNAEFLVVNVKESKISQIADDITDLILRNGKTGISKELDLVSDLYLKALNDSKLPYNLFKKEENVTTLPVDDKNPEIVYEQFVANFKKEKENQTHFDMNFLVHSDKEFYENVYNGTSDDLNIKTKVTWNPVKFFGNPSFRAAETFKTTINLMNTTFRGTKMSKIHESSLIIDVEPRELNRYPRSPVKFTSGVDVLRLNKYQSTTKISTPYMNRIAYRQMTYATPRRHSSEHFGDSLNQQYIFNKQLNVPLSARQGIVPMPPSSPSDTATLNPLIKHLIDVNAASLIIDPDTRNDKKPKVLLPGPYGSRQIFKGLPEYGVDDVKDTAKKIYESLIPPPPTTRNPQLVPKPKPKNPWVPYSLRVKSKLNAAGFGKDILGPDGRPLELYFNLTTPQAVSEEWLQPNGGSNYMLNAKDSNKEDSNTDILGDRIRDQMSPRRFAQGDMMEGMDVDDLGDMADAYRGDLGITSGRVGPNEMRPGGMGPGGMRSGGMGSSGMGPGETGPYGMDPGGMGPGGMGPGGMDPGGMGPGGMGPGEMGPGGMGPGGMGPSGMGPGGIGPGGMESGGMGPGGMGPGGMGPSGMGPGWMEPGGMGSAGMGRGGMGPSGMGPGGMGPGGMGPGGMGPGGKGPGGMGPDGMGPGGMGPGGMGPGGMESGGMGPGGMGPGGMGPSGMGPGWMEPGGMGSAGMGRGGMGPSGMGPGGMGPGGMGPGGMGPGGMGPGGMGPDGMGPGGMGPGGMGPGGMGPGGMGPGGMGPGGMGPGGMGPGGMGPGEMGPGGMGPGGMGPGGMGPGGMGPGGMGPGGMGPGGMGPGGMGPGEMGLGEMGLGGMGPGGMGPGGMGPGGMGPGGMGPGGMGPGGMGPGGMGPGEMGPGGMGPGGIGPGGMGPGGMGPGGMGPGGMGPGGMGPSGMGPGGMGPDGMGPGGMGPGGMGPGGMGPGKMGPGGMGPGGMGPDGMGPGEMGPGGMGPGGMGPGGMGPGGMSPGGMGPGGMGPGGMGPGGMGPGGMGPGGMGPGGLGPGGMGPRGMGPGGMGPGGMGSGGMGPGGMGPGGMGPDGMGPGGMGLGGMGPGKMGPGGMGPGGMGPDGMGPGEMGPGEMGPGGMGPGGMGPGGMGPGGMGPSGMGSGGMGSGGMGPEVSGRMGDQGPDYDAYQEEEPSRQVNPEELAANDGSSVYKPQGKLAQGVIDEKNKNIRNGPSAQKSLPYNFDDVVKVRDFIAPARDEGINIDPYPAQLDEAGPVEDAMNPVPPAARGGSDLSQFGGLGPGPPDPMQQGSNNFNAKLNLYTQSKYPLYFTRTKKFFTGARPITHVTGTGVWLGPGGTTGQNLRIFQDGSARYDPPNPKPENNLPEFLKAFITTTFPTSTNALEKLFILGNLNDTMVTKMIEEEKKKRDFMPKSAEIDMDSKKIREEIFQKGMAQYPKAPNQLLKAVDPGDNNISLTFQTKQVETKKPNDFSKNKTNKASNDDTETIRTKSPAKTEVTVFPKVNQTDTKADNYTKNLERQRAKKTTRRTTPPSSITHQYTFFPNPEMLTQIYGMSTVTPMPASVSKLFSDYLSSLQETTKIVPKIISPQRPKKPKNVTYPSYWPSEHHKNKYNTNTNDYSVSTTSTTPTTTTTTTTTTTANPMDLLESPFPEEETTVHASSRLTLPPKTTVTYDIEDIIEEFEVTQETPTHIVELKKEMKDLGMGYMEFLVLKLADHIALTKVETPEEYIMYTAFEPEVIEFFKEKRPLLSLGRTVERFARELASSLTTQPFDVIQSYANMVHRSLTNRTAYVGKKLNRIIDFVEDLYNADEGLKILDVIDDLNGFPANNISSKSMAHNILKVGVVDPYIRINMTPDRKELVLLLTEYVHNRFYSGQGVPIVEAKRRYFGPTWTINPMPERPDMFYLNLLNKRRPNLIKPNDLAPRLEYPKFTRVPGKINNEIPRLTREEVNQLGNVVRERFGDMTRMKDTGLNFRANEIKGFSSEYKDIYPDGMEPNPGFRPPEEEVNKRLLNMAKNMGGQNMEPTAKTVIIQPKPPPPTPPPNSNGDIMDYSQNSETTSEEYSREKEKQNIRKIIKKGNRKELTIFKELHHLKKKHRKIYDKYVKRHQKYMSKHHHRAKMHKYEKVLRELKKRKRKHRKSKNKMRNMRKRLRSNEGVALEYTIPASTLKAFTPDTVTKQIIKAGDPKINDLYNKLLQDLKKIPKLFNNTQIVGKYYAQSTKKLNLNALIRNKAIKTGRVENSNMVIIEDNKDSVDAEIKGTESEEECASDERELDMEMKQLEANLEDISKALNEIKKNKLEAKTKTTAKRIQKEKSLNKPVDYYLSESRENELRQFLHRPNGIKYAPMNKQTNIIGNGIAMTANYNKRFKQKYLHRFKTTPRQSLEQYTHLNTHKTRNYVTKQASSILENNKFIFRSPNNYDYDVNEDADDTEGIYIAYFESRRANKGGESKPKLSKLNKTKILNSLRRKLIEREVNKESSYSDEEVKLKHNINNAIYNRKNDTVQRRHNVIPKTEPKVNILRRASSVSDEEPVLKANIYKSFGFDRNFERIGAADFQKRATDDDWDYAHGVKLL